MRAVADANDELRGVFTVDWNQAGVNHPARFDKVGEIHGCLADRAFSGN
jgi:hypothetical protein